MSAAMRSPCSKLPTPDATRPVIPASTAAQPPVLSSAALPAARLRSGRRIAGMVLLGALAWLLAACSGGDTDSAATSDAAADAEDAATPNDDSDADSAAGDESGAGDEATAADSDSGGAESEADDPPATSTTTTTTTTLYPVPEASTVSGLLALDRPLVIGHAGGDRSWPHSTMYGFREAAKAGADVLELDLQLTGDGVLVVHHDDTVDRTSGSQGLLADLTLAELQELDNAYWWSESWPSHDQPDSAYAYRGIRSGEKPPPEGYTPDDFRVETLRSVAEAFPAHVLDIEIKVPSLPEGGEDLDTARTAAEALAAEIAELDRADSVIVVSFSAEVMSTFREAAPDVATSPSTAEMLDWFLNGAEFAPSDLVVQVPPDYGEIDVLAPDIVERVRQDGLDIWVWPNDSDAQENADFYAEAIEKGADGIIAGRPEVAVDRLRGLSG